MILDFDRQVQTRFFTEELDSSLLVSSSSPSFCQNWIFILSLELGQQNHTSTGCCW